MDKIYGIYKITNPKNKVYIGQSIDIERRKSDYSKTFNVNRQPKLHNSIKKYGWENHKFEIIEECEFDKLNERERYWQEFYNCIKDNNLNCTLVNTSEKKRKVSDETRKKLSNAHKGKKLTPEHIEKVARHRRKPVLQYDLDGNFIKRWDSVKEPNIRHVSSCASKNRKTAGGYIWIYEEENDVININLPKKLVKYDIYLNKICIYRSVKEASIDSNISRSEIFKNLKGKTVSIKGYIWKYE